MQIGVIGCVRALPTEFPLQKAENAGNMVHGDAPFRILPNSVSAVDQQYYKSLGYKSFVEFVNDACSHLVVTLANTLRLNKESLPSLTRMSDLLRQVKKPIVIFGLGAQSDSDVVGDQVVPQEAIDLLHVVADRTASIGVRGEFTEEVVRKKVGLTNVYVTGCPSLFSNPAGVKAIRSGVDLSRGRMAFNGTKFHLDTEKALLHKAIGRDYFLVEPVNKFLHEYYESVSGGQSEAEFPYFLRSYRSGQPEESRRGELVDFFRRNYRLFRGLADWFAFNQSMVSATFGSRFHVNMASILSGRPALWLTHDSRTRELVSYMNLPHRPLDSFSIEDIDQLDWETEYRRFIDGFESVRSRFERYLILNGLPAGSVSKAAFE